MINALRGHLAEHGVVAAQNPAHVKRLVDALDAPATGLPPIVHELGQLHVDQIAVCAGKIADLEKTLRTEAAKGEVTARWQTMPGIGPITAMAVEAFAPPMETLRRGIAIVARTDGARMATFAAWLGLVPLQRSTGGKQRLGKTSKMGEVVFDPRTVFRHR